MSIWTEHAKREHRRRQFEAFNQWCLDHPTQAFFLSFGISILLFEISVFVHLGLEQLARHLR